MEKKLAVIVDNKEVTTGIGNTELCSSVCDVAMETCSSERHDAYRGGGVAGKKRYVEVLEEGYTTKRCCLYFFCFVKNQKSCKLVYENVISRKNGGKAILE